MATKGYSFQDDEKTIIDIEIDMDIVVEKEKNEWMRKMYLYLFLKQYFLKNMKFQNWLNVFVGEKWRIFLLFDETFNRRKILTDET